MPLDLSESICQGASEGSNAALSTRELASQLRAAKTELLKEVCQGLDQVAAMIKPDASANRIEFNPPATIQYHIDSLDGCGGGYRDGPALAMDPTDPLPREVGTNMQIKNVSGMCTMGTEGVRVEIRATELSLMVFRGFGRIDGEKLVQVELTDKDIRSEPIRHERIGAFIKGVAKVAAQSGYAFAD